MEIKEGYMPFKGYQTYYRVVGQSTPGKFPLLLLHGGPGSTHNYFELLDSLAEEGRQIISYDQIGCGNSYVDGHPELWTTETWIEELVALRRYLHLDRIHLLGQSWGGMMILAYLIDHKPQGIVSAILSSTLSSSALWSHEQHRLISFMPKEEQEAIKQAETTGNYTSADYIKANDHYTLLHACSPATVDSPECLWRKKRFGTESYETAWGPNEYTPLGNLRTFNYTDRLKEIQEPCLVISGTNDESTPLVAKTMADGIPHSKWALLDGARHMTFVDNNYEYCKLLSQWMNGIEETAE